MYSKAGLIAVSLAFVLTTACKSDEQKAAEAAAKQMEVAAKQMEEASKTGTANMGDAMAAMGAAMSGAATAGKKLRPSATRSSRRYCPSRCPA